MSARRDVIRRVLDEHDEFHWRLATDSMVCACGVATPLGPGRMIYAG